jgi:hypothetical protein
MVLLEWNSLTCCRLKRVCLGKGKMLMSVLMMKRQCRSAFAAQIDIEEMKRTPPPRAVNPLGVLVWPLGIAATGFLFAATMTVFIVWLPIVVFFAVIPAVLRRKQIDTGDGFNFFQLEFCPPLANSKGQQPRNRRPAA